MATPASSIIRKMAAISETSLMQPASAVAATLTVYLDSSDYSALSDSRRQTEALDRTRNALLAMACSGVRFAFSGTHLSEMAPLQPEYTPSASERAGLLVALCGRNALVSFDRLLGMEVARLVDDNAPSVQAISDDGTWFPELKDLVGPVQAVDPIREAIAEAIAEVGYSTQLRRKVMRTFFRDDGRPRPRLRKMLAHLGATGDVTEVLKRYPMRPEHMRVLWRYVAGQASPAEAERAFLESLRDPSWMMRKLSPVLHWVRATSRDFIGQFQQVIPQARAFGQLFPAARDALLSDQKWRELEDQNVLQMANLMVGHWHRAAARCKDVNRVDERCPGLSTMVRTLHRVVRDTVTQQPREIRESDMVDAMHAMYAPYVHVFRADRYMAPHIQQLVRRWGTRVVPRLEELPGAIEELLTQA